VIVTKQTFFLSYQCVFDRAMGRIDSVELVLVKSDSHKNHLCLNNFM